MAIDKRYIEVEDECLGPDKREGQWEMFIIIHHVTEYSKETKYGVKKYKKRKKDVISIKGRTKKETLQKLEKYLTQKDVFLLDHPPLL